ncbi:MAG: ATP-binding protein [Planctomycetales bacterium]|nr:ATP-binding protein [Planctomycetales bacterium]
MLDAPLLVEFAPASGAAQNDDNAWFVAGQENRLALAALQQLALFHPPDNPARSGVAASPEEPSTTHSPSSGSSHALLFNPLVLTGPTGAGKTLIVEHAVAIREGVRRYTAAEWIYAYRQAQAEDRLPQWRTENSRLKLLAIEDIDRLPIPERAQYELRLAIDRLVASKAQVVCTAQREPGQWREISPYLRDRLIEGLVVPLRYPEREARSALLRLEAHKRGIQVTQDQLDQLAAKHDGSAQRLRGVLAAWEMSLVTGAAPLSEERGELVLAAELKPKLQAIARYFGISLGQLTSSSRRKSLVHARGIAIYILRKTTRASYTQIGVALGGRDHTTILHAARKTAAAAIEDPATQVALGELEKILST